MRKLQQMRGMRNSFPVFFHACRNLENKRDPLTSDLAAFQLIFEKLNGFSCQCIKIMNDAGKSHGKNTLLLLQFP